MPSLSISGQVFSDTTQRSRIIGRPALSFRNVKFAITMVLCPGLRWSCVRDLGIRRLAAQGSRKILKNERLPKSHMGPLLHLLSPTQLEIETNCERHQRRRHHCVFISGVTILNSMARSPTYLIYSSRYKKCQLV